MDKIDANVRIGHVHLKVADLERAVDFYNGVLGFEITQKYGESAAFLSAGGYHHHIALNTWESLGGSPPPSHARRAGRCSAPGVGRRHRARRRRRSWSQ